MHETCFTKTVSLQRLGEKNRTGKRPVHHKKALQIRVEDIRKSLHLALEEPRVAQYVNIDHLGVKGRNIFQNHGLLRNGLVLGLATTENQESKKIIGDGKELAKCMAHPTVAAMEHLKHCARSLLAHPRLLWQYVR